MNYKEGINEVIEYHPNGQIQRKAFLLKKGHSYNWVGECKSWHNNGQLSFEGIHGWGSYVEGWGIFYHRNGTINIKEFKTRGRLNKTRECLDSDGTRYGIETYKDNRFHGVRIKFDDPVGGILYQHAKTLS